MKRLLICNLLLFGSLCALQGLELTNHIAGGGTKRFGITACCYGINIEDREKKEEFNIAAPKWLEHAGHTTPLVEVSPDESFFVVLSYNRVHSTKYALKHKSLKCGSLMGYKAK